MTGPLNNLPQKLKNSNEMFLYNYTNGLIDDTK